MQTDIDEGPLETRNGIPLLSRKSGARQVTPQIVKDLFESEAVEAANTTPWDTNG
jgi:hypothetical protein